MRIDGRADIEATSRREPLAFNVANALGPWLGGTAIAAGHGWVSTGWVGAALALGGFAIWVVAALDVRTTRAAGSGGLVEKT